MIYLGIEWPIGTHGGGTHMWNLYYSQVQYQRRVSLKNMSVRLTLPV